MANTGLVLEGGGMRGAYTAGVLDAFLDLGICFKDIIGVSAGAANAISYISRQRGRNREVYRRFAPDDRYLSLKNLLKTGSFFGMDYVFYEVPKKHLPFDYDTYKDSDQRLTVVATNVKDGTPFYKVIDDVGDDKKMRYLCASAAIPMASAMVRVDGHTLMDGGASNSIPIEYSLQKGNVKNVVVLTRNRGFRVKKGPMANFAYVRYPFHRAFARTVANRFEYYNHSLEMVEREEADGNAIAICPVKPIVATRFERDPDVLVALYEEGYADTMVIQERLYAFLADSESVRIQK